MFDDAGSVDELSRADPWEEDARDFVWTVAGIVSGIICWSPLVLPIRCWNGGVVGNEEEADPDVLYPDNESRYRGRTVPQIGPIGRLGRLMRFFRWASICRRVKEARPLC